MQQNLMTWSSGHCGRIMGAVLLIGLLMASAAQAADLTFDADTATASAQDGSGLWTANAADTNWWDGVSNTNWNNATPDNAIFGAGSGAAGTVTQSQDLAIGNLTFNAPGSGSYTIDGNGNALNFGIANPLLTVAAGVTGTVSATSASDTRDLDINLGGGTSHLVLDGSTMAFDSMDILSAGKVTIKSGATVTTDGNSNSGAQDFGIRIGPNVTLTVDGTVSLSGAMGTPSGSGNRVININPGATASMAGMTVGWNGNTTLNMNGGMMTVSGTIIHRDSGAGVINLNEGELAAGRIMVESGNGSFTLNFNGGTLKANSDNLFLDSSSKNEHTSLRVLNGGAVIDSNAKTIEAVQAFEQFGTGGLTKHGAGAMTYSGGSYTGATTVTDGTLNLSFNKRATAVASGVVGDLYNRESKLVLNGGGLTVTGRAQAPSITRNFRVGGNGLYNRCARDGNTADLVAGMTVSGVNIPADTYVVSVRDGSRIMLNKAATNAASAVVSLTLGMVNDTTWQTINAVELQQSAAISVNTNAGPGTTLMVKAVTGAGSLTKAGSGKLILAGANTYSGDTIISNGTVWLPPQTGDVSVANPSFETHGALAGGTWGYSPSGATWVFSGAGISSANNVWVAASADIEGSYAAFIQNSGTMTQSLTVEDTGYYLLSFNAANRPNYSASGLMIKVDGATVANFAHGVFEAGAVFQPYTALVYIEAGTRSLSFNAIATPPDSATAIDTVALEGLGGSLPTNTIVSLTSGAKMDLGGNVQSVKRLFVDGQESYRGLYGAPGSGASNIDSNSFIGTGMLNVWDGIRRSTILLIQ